MQTTKTGAGDPLPKQVFSYRVQPNLPVLGPKYRKQLGVVCAALAALDPNDVAQWVHAGKAVPITDEILLEPDEILVDIVGIEGWAVAEKDGYIVALDTTLTPALVREGMARDLVHAIQGIRKAMGLAINETITLRFARDAAQQDGDEIRTMLDEYRHYICGETLANRFSIAPISERAKANTVTLDGRPLVIGIEKSLPERNLPMEENGTFGPLTAEAIGTLYEYVGATGRPYLITVSQGEAGEAIDIRYFESDEDEEEHLEYCTDRQAVAEVIAAMEAEPFWFVDEGAHA